MVGSQDLLICTACGTQFDVPFSQPINACRICDVCIPQTSLPFSPVSPLIPQQDPRQFVPAEGQSWTSLSNLQSDHFNTFTPFSSSDKLWSIHTEPKFAIGQRCILIQTPTGNVLWDCITLLDNATIKRIKSMGGLKALVISHPHYYSTHLDWAEAFECPVYVAREDEGWCCREDVSQRRKLIEGTHEGLEEVGLEGVVVGKPGGHFPGSLVLCWERRLFIADTMVTAPSAYYHTDRPPGTTSFAFMWSIPNMIPLPPSELIKMWKVLKTFEFQSTHAAFVGTDIYDKNVKSRVLESMKIQARNEGYAEHEILDQEFA